MSEHPATPNGPDLTAGVPANSLAEGVPLLGHVNEEPVILVRRGSEVFAIGATCSHRGGLLADGLVEDDTVRCPGHDACSSRRTGEALGAPAQRPVAGYEIAQRDGQVFVRGAQPKAGPVRRVARPRTPREPVMAKGPPRSLFRRIVEEIPEAVVLTDPQGAIRLWNRGAETVFGYRAEDALGQSLDLIIPERFRARHWDGYHRVMATGVTHHGGQLLAVPATRKDGQRISIEFSIALLKDARGAVTDVVAIVRDVTARWEAERVLSRRLAASEAPPGAAPGSPSATR